MYFWQIENFAYGEINERSFSNPHPSAVSVLKNDNVRKRRNIFHIS